MGVLSRFENKIMEMRKRRSGGGSEVGNSEKKIKPRTSEERERKRKGNENNSSKRKLFPEKSNPRVREEGHLCLFRSPSDQCPSYAICPSHQCLSFDVGIQKGVKEEQRQGGLGARVVHKRTGLIPRRQLKFWRVGMNLKVVIPRFLYEWDDAQSSSSTFLLFFNFLFHLFRLSSSSLTTSKLHQAPQSHHSVALVLGVMGIVANNLAHIQPLPTTPNGLWTNKPREAQNYQVNNAMLRNVPRAVIPNAPDLRHVLLQTGAKQYLGPFEVELFGKIEARDPSFTKNMPRLDVLNFYYTQEYMLFDEIRKSKGLFLLIAS
ncbi:hypothetical protein VNO80_21497 [Phaseolus coccineus]|uniref:Uncharacterized protein n=1 Tax=Phaseolus coccineus TaxID=3886 RepID=A0AAN9M873_PHACN